MEGSCVEFARAGTISNDGAQEGSIVQGQVMLQCQLEEMKIQEIIYSMLIVYIKLGIGRKNGCSILVRASI